VAAYRRDAGEQIPKEKHGKYSDLVSILVIEEASIRDKEFTFLQDEESHGNKDHGR
jgi:hypothetical protein